MSGLSVHLTNDSAFTAALYLRDRVDPSALAAFPHLTPPLPALTRAALPGAAWDAWIADIASAPTDGARTVEPNDPELARLLDEHRRDAARWTTRHADDDTLTSYRPAWMPAMLAAGSGEGQLDCEVLPVAGLWWQDVSPRRLLVSQVTHRDHSLMDRLLTQRVQLLLN